MVSWERHRDWKKFTSDNRCEMVGGTIRFINLYLYHISFIHLDENLMVAELKLLKLREA